MQTINFKDYMSQMLSEAPHQRLELAMKGPLPIGVTSRKAHVVREAKAIAESGEETGVEHKMPAGSSRLFVEHTQPTPCKHYTSEDDKNPTDFQMKTGTKVAITGPLDKHHKKSEHDGMSLGRMQTCGEGGDYWVNKTYRVLAQHPNGKEGHFVDNREQGIFPPLLNHDHEKHDWSEVGTAKNITKSRFRQLTKNADYPKGIEHQDFAEALIREHDKNNGNYWKRSSTREAHLDHVMHHPLTQRFQDYHGNTGNPPHDLGAIQNMGEWTHPDGTNHIVARDHGFTSEVNHAYQQARMAAMMQHINRNNRY